MVPVFLIEGVFQCDIARRQSVKVLCMLHKIRCNPIRPLDGAVRVPHVRVWITRDALVAHQYIIMRLLAAEPHSAAGLVYSLSVSLWNDHV